MKLEILSNINMDSLKFYMKEFEFVHSCDFGNYMLDLLDENSSLHKTEANTVLLFLDMDELNETMEQILNAVKFFIEKTNKTIVMNTLCSTPQYISTFLHNELKQELTYNTAILDFADKHSNVLILDFAKLIKKVNFFDEKFWYLGRIKYTKQGFELIARELKLLLNTYKYGSKKVLVLDMDNTLWGGIIGEDEINLSNDGIGKIYLDFQKKIKKLKSLGVLLAICSKNNYEDGIKGLNHINSILHEDDFIIKKINWQDKASNIQEILAELNLGANSLVFIDDNPVEREYVKNIFPDITVPEFPKDIYKLNTWFIDVIEENFSKINLTKEDLKKQEQYTAKIKRDNEAKAMSYDEFLKNLEININFYIDNQEHIERYAQMTQKTNQFNLTTKRYTVAEIYKFIQEPEYTVIAIDYSDKFANEGITGLVVLHHHDKFIEIDTLLLSCRILKRGVEKAIFDKLDELYPTTDVIGVYSPTDRNNQVENLYPEYGFVQIGINKYIKKGKK